jgi:leucyl/phenylalanyl-tRNA--protein transferase
VTVYRLDRRRLDFPPAEEAEVDGLLAVGGDLRPERLLRAYCEGIFPWFSEGKTPYWFSPDPRCVLDPARFAPSRSLRRTLAAGEFQISFDREFDAVLAACAAVPRAHESGTWITPDFAEGYGGLHRLGFAHSVEARREGVLVGGLYGVAVGRVFCGESMFRHVPDASKVAFAALCAALAAADYDLVDCQAPTDHLKSLGAVEIPRAEYLRVLRRGLLEPTGAGLRPGRWDDSGPPPLGRG